MKNKLEEYISGSINYNSMMNYLRLDKDIYQILGKYAYEDVFDKKLPNKLSYFNDYLKSSFNTKFNIFSKKERAYSSLAILLLTNSDFVIDKLKEVYGEPIYHDEFGEGFDGEYDDETDIETEPEIKESFASYFITISDVDFHIGYDHRGLTIEVKNGTSVDYLIIALKKFIYDMYKNNNKII